MSYVTTYVQGRLVEVWHDYEESQVSVVIEGRANNIYVGSKVTDLSFWVKLGSYLYRIAPLLDFSFFTIVY